MIHKVSFVITCVVLLFLVRISAFFIYSPHLSNGQFVSGEFTVLNDPRSGKTGQRVQIPIGNNLASILVNAQLPSTPQVVYGQHIKYTGSINSRLTSDGRTMYTVYVKKMEVIEGHNPFLSILSNFRQQSLDAYFAALPKPEAELLAGMVFGRKPEFAQNLTKDMQISGVTHVVAASGMNVTFVIGLLSSICNMFFSRKVASVLSLIGVGSYLILAGLQPSIVRAGIMGSGMLIAGFLGRQYTAWYWLLLCVIFMLFTNPSLIIDIGFQLSVMATFGLFTIKPLFTRRKFFDDLTTTTSAQITTLPILLTAFGTYGPLSILVNFLVLWMVAPVMIIGVAGAFASLMIEPVGELIIFLSHPLLLLFLSIIQWFGELGVTWTVSEIPWALVVGYYFIITSVIYLSWKHKY